MPEPRVYPRSARPDSRHPRRRFSWLRLFILLVLAGSLAVVGTGAGFVFASLRGMPALADVEPRAKITTFVYDAQGNPIHELFEENRQPVPLDRVPLSLQNAFIASEDRQFWTHHGFDLRAVVRAAYVNLVRGGVYQGGSTITQQLAKNAFLTHERTIQRKVQELLFALQLERRYTKEQILELYLNFIYFGHRAFGVQAAAQTYFGKDVSELTVAESALLAAVANLPAVYDPYRDPERALERRRVVLNEMVEAGYLTRDEAEAAAAEPLELAPLKDPFSDYPHPWFMDYVVRQLLRLFDEKLVYGGGLKVYTTLDRRIQQAAEAAVGAVLDGPFPLGQGDQPEAAVVVMDPHTGEIRALVGGRQRPGGQLLWNGAVDARRQPGSAIKPLAVYTPAIALGHTAATVVDDSPKTWIGGDGKPWTPMNYTRDFRGLVDYRTALKDSINVPAIKILEVITPQVGVSMAQKLGLSTLVTEGPRNDLGLATAIGGLTRGVTVLDMVTAYGTLANGGVRVEPVAITKVVDRYGNVLYEARPKKAMVVTEQVAYIITDMLRTVITDGTGRGADIGRPAAGKTGTTDKYTDAWFVGYTPDYIAGVWMGYRDEQKPMPRVVGGSYPAMIWQRVMTAAHQGLPPKDFVAPTDIVVRQVSTKSGKLAGPLTPPEFVRDELFIKGTEPTELDDAFVQVAVCAEDPKVRYAAGCGCTPVTRLFLNRPEVEPYTDEKGNTYVPADRALAPPTIACAVASPPPTGGEAGGKLAGEPDVVINVTATNFTWNPPVIRVRKGQHVRLNLTALDVPHGFGLPGYGIYRTLPVGETVTVDFVADKAGTFAYFCTVYCGVGHDKMVARLEVIQ